MSPPQDRRLLRFQTIDDIIADLKALSAAHQGGTLRQAGKWPPGAIFDHLAHAAACSFDGFDEFTGP